LLELALDVGLEDVWKLAVVADQDDAPLRA
jgi:hypothetical protein